MLIENILLILVFSSPFFFIRFVLVFFFILFLFLFLFLSFFLNLMCFFYFKASRLWEGSGDEKKTKAIRTFLAQKKKDGSSSNRTHLFNTQSIKLESRGFFSFLLFSFFILSFFLFPSPFLLFIHRIWQEASK